MVNFRDYTSPSSKLKYLIESTESLVQTKLLVHTPLTGWRLITFTQILQALFLEWAEDTLGRNQEILVAADIYDAFYASLFPYDRNSYILQAFCKAWCPKKYTILISVGELSVSLWELHTLGGLPIRGSFYEEVIPETTELTCVDGKDQRYIPRVCKYLFTAFHYLQESKTDNSRVSLSRWIGFWYKKALRYEPALPRREKKTARLKFTHNPTGAIPETSQWSRDEEGVFSKLGVRPAKKEETYLAEFLSCWLCAFVLPSEEGDFIQPKTFKMTTMMATKQKISLAVPVLESISSGLSKEARKRIHQGDNITWTSTILNNSELYDYIDNNDAPELELNYFASIRFGYLPLRNENSVIIEPYSPHRFSRQFGFYQRIPSVSAYDNRSSSLDEGLRYWRNFVLHRSMSHANFLPVIPNVKKLFADDYKTWWLKIHENFLDSYLQTLVLVVGPISTKISEVAP
ncbi:hypothetical protein HAX54_038749 [Datura stramonium]|uniref:Aminotransferase-like plant mobile domain-containing protein n=1 Tax=Datura stramonium TaxID=4076 RepID=A0ABS8SII9_DATST|nr:hypothetical protein [Datura stramonium]